MAAPLAATAGSSAPALIHANPAVRQMAPQAPAAVALSATLRDAVLDDANGNGKADPGDTLRYTVVVTNSGDTDALGVVFSSTLDTNTMPITGALQSSAVAIGDSYTPLRNTPLNVAAPGVLSNDSGNPAPAARPQTKPTNAGGSVTINAGGSFTYTPLAGYFGPDSFAYTAENLLGSSTATVTLDVRTAPLVANDSYTATLNTPRAIAAPGVLANDAGNPAPAAAPGAYASAGGGSVTLNADGSFTYTPPASFFGADTFTYTATNNVGTTGGTVTMDVQAPPIVHADQFTTTANTPLNVGTPGVLANDTGNPAPAAVAFTGATTRGGAITITANGSFSYTPPTDAVSPPDDTVVYTATNLVGTVTSTISFVINPPGPPATTGDTYTATRNTTRTVAAPGVLANDTPNFATIVDYQATTPQGGSVSLNANGSFTYQPLNGFYSPPSDTFTYTLRNVLGESSATVTLDVQAAPMPTGDAYTTTANTPLIVSAPGVLANDTGNPVPVAVPFSRTTTRGGVITVTASGSFSYTPPLNTVSPPTDTVVYTATNVVGTATSTITIFINPPGPPTAANDSLTATYQTQRVIAAPGVLANDTTNFAAVSGYQAATAQGGSVTLNADGSLTYQPPAAFLSPPEDTFTYTLQNVLGASTATVSMTVLPPPPVATNDSYAATGNIRINVAANGVLGNDQVNFATIIGFQASSANGGQVALNANGSFTYNPPPGFEGNDTFTYTLGNVTGNSIGTVSIAVNDVVWFVDNSLGVNGDGRLTSPYNTLAAVQGADLDEPGDVIFVYQGSGVYAGGVALENYQALIGQGVALATALSGLGITLAANSDALPGAAGSPTLNNAAGHAITLAQGNTLRGLIAGATNAASYALFGSNVVTLNVSNVTVNNTAGGGVSLASGTVTVTLDSLTSTGSGGYGVTLDAIGGNFTASAGAISNATSADFRINAGAANVTYNGSITDNSGNTVHITSRAGGTITFGGAINDTGSGIIVSTNTAGSTVFNGAVTLNTGASTAANLTSNTGHAVSFNAGLNATTSSATTLNATGGTLTVLGSAHRLTATNATALNLSNITLGAGGVTFYAVNATGGANGIVLSNVTGGAFQVTGDGPSDPANTTRGRTTARQGGGSIALGSGGTLQNTTGNAVSLNNANNVVLRNMVISRATLADISGVDVTNGSNLTLDNIRITGFGNNGLLATGLNGLAVLHTEVVNNAKSADSVANDESNVRLVNVAGTATVQNSSISDVQETNFWVIGNAASTLQLNISNVLIATTAQDSNGGGGLQASLSGSYDLRLSVSNSSLQNNYTRGVQYAANGSSRGTVSVSNCMIEGSFVAIDIANNASTAQDVRFDVSSNTINQTAFASGHGINIVLGGVSAAGAVLQGTVSNNAVGNAAVADSGSDQGNGINVDARGAGTLTALVANNTVRQIRQLYGIQLSAGEGSATLNATLQNNNASVNTGSALSLAGLGMSIGALPADANTVCLGLQGNTSFVGNGAYAGVDLYTFDGNPTVEFVGYTGANNDETQVATFLNSIATVTPGATAGLSVAFLAGTVRGRTPDCPQPAPIASLLRNETIARHSGATKVLSAPASASAVRRNIERTTRFAPLAGAISHAIGTLPAGQAITLTFDVSILSPVPVGVMSIEVQGEFTGDNFAPIVTDDPDTAAPGDATRTQLSLVSDLVITQFAAPAVGRTEQPLTFTLVYTNLGPEYADAFTITDQLPVTLTNPSVATNRPVTLAGMFPHTFVGGPLAAGASGMITISGIVTPLVVHERITNTVSISAVSDLTPTNNLATLGVNLLAEDRCWALRDTTVYSSPTVLAVQDAVDDATPGDLIRVAGYCFGVSSRAGVVQSLFISKPLSLQGGYTTTNWITSYPLTQPTTIDAQDAGRVVYITGTTGNLSNLILLDGQITGDGAGIYADDALSLTGVLLISNQATGSGGGLYLAHRNGGTSRIANSVFGRNNATGNGMALYLLNPAGAGGAVEVVHTTIGFPTFGNGAAIHVATGTVTVTNSIIASHQTAVTVSGGAAFMDGNLLSGNTAMAAGNVIIGDNNWLGNAAFVSPLFDDYRLGVSSAAIDIGVNAGAGADADNAPRPQRQGFDAGAYEATAANDVCFARIQSSGAIFSATTALAVQRAIDAATGATETIQVAGTCIDVNTRGGLRQAIHLDKSLTLRGGYTPSNWLVAYPITQPTTINASNLGRALYVSGPATPTIRDLRFTGGDAAGLGGGPVIGQDAGGGVYVLSATAALVNNTIELNAGERGGGVYVTNSSANFIANLIVNNIAPGTNGRGGGVYLHQSDGTSFSSNTVMSNTAGRNGGGLYVNLSAASLSNNVVQSNTAQRNGGGLYVSDSPAVIAGNTIRANGSNNLSAGGGGGGVYLVNSAGVTATPVLNRNSIISNTTLSNGGGVLIDVVSPTLSGNAIRLNSAAAWGGGVFVDNASPTLINNLLAQNTANQEGAALAAHGSSPWLIHTTIAQNDSPSGAGVYAYADTSQAPARPSAIALTNTIVASHTVGLRAEAGSSLRLMATLFAGNGADSNGAGVNRTLDYFGPPAFADPSAGDYRLTLDSAAIDRGVNAGVTTDFEDTPRPVGAVSDIGYDEAQFIPDLAISKSVAPSVALPGQPITYTILFTNVGDGIVRSTRITDVLPAQFTSVISAATATAGITPVAALPGTAAWVVDDLRPQDGGVITLSGSVDPLIDIGLDFTNTVAITAENETNPANNLDTASVSVVLPGVRFSAAEYAVTEGITGGQALVTAVLDQPSFVAVSVTLSTVDHTAHATTDYAPVSRALLFPPGATLVTATIGITDDLVLEGVESLTLTLSNGRWATVSAPDQATLFILDDDVPDLSFGTTLYTVTESAGLAHITVTLSGAYPVTVTGQFTASDGAALSPGDFAAATGIFTFTPNVTRTTFSVAIIDDALDEPAETVDLAIGDPVNAIVVAPATATLVIVDNDPPPSVFFSQATYTVTESVPAVQIQVKLSGASGLTVTVRYSTTNGAARAPSDYLTATGVLTFAPGEMAHTFNVGLANDDRKEPTETVTLRLLSPSNATLGSPNPSTLNILDDDLYRVYLPIARTPQQPFAQFSAPAYTAAENVAGGAVPITVTLSWGYPLVVSVSYTASNGTALSPADYAPLKGTLVFSPYVTQRVIMVNVVNDTLFEGNETVRLTLGGPLTKTVVTGTNPVVLTIVNDDPAPIIRFSRPTYSIAENAGMAIIQATLSGASGLTATARYTTSNGAAVAGIDYTAVNGSLTFAPGVTQTTFSVPLIDNVTYNGNRTVNLRIGPPVGNATLGVTQTAILTITDNEPAPIVQFSSRVYTVSRSAAQVLLTTTLNFASSVTATVRYATSNHTARAGEDYQAVSGTLVFPPGVVTRVISVPVLSTTAFTRTESLTMTLSAPVNAALGMANPAAVVLQNAATAPDLIVQSIRASGGGITVVIRNIGTAAVTDDFWVDLYVNPNPPPTGVNQIWSDGRSAQGAVWGVTASAFPSLAPGGSLTLTLNGTYYAAEYSNISGPLPADAVLYAQADSANELTTYGGILEGHEMIGDAYNNIASTANANDASLFIDATANETAQPLEIPQPGESNGLPPRP